MIQKPASTSELIDERLKALKYWPVQPHAHDFLVQKVQDQFSAFINTTLKDWKTVHKILADADPTKPPAHTTPQAPAAKSTGK
jgi:hypothetical protein